MGKRDNIYRIKDMVEYDEAFVGKAVNNRAKGKIKLGRGSQKRIKVAVQSTILEDLDSGKLKKSCRYFKMTKIKNLDAKTAQVLINEFID